MKETIHPTICYGDMAYHASDVVGRSAERMALFASENDRKRLTAVIFEGSASVHQIACSRNSTLGVVGALCKVRFPSWYYSARMILSRSSLASGALHYTSTMATLC